MSMKIEQISQDTAEALCRTITSDLPEYFGLPEANEQYALGTHACQNFAAKRDDNYLGLISIDFPYPNSCNIYWMAVLREFQGQGIGRQLIEHACNFAKEKGAKTMTVETLSPLVSEKNYLRTYDFYQSTGFSPLLNLKPEGYKWDMVYMCLIF
jgi:GNAT superfamily N-acetyltransferase